MSSIAHSRLLSVETVTLSNSRAVRIEQFYDDNLYRWITVEWDGDRLAKSRWCSPQLKMDREYVYRAESREPEEFYVKADGTRVPADEVNRPLPKGVTLKSLAETIRRRLLKVVPPVAVAARIRQPVYCLALAYDGGGDILPPLLGIGLERERKAWVAAQGRKASRRAGGTTGRWSGRARTPLPAGY